MRIPLMTSAVTWVLTLAACAQSPTAAPDAAPAAASGAPFQVLEGAWSDAQIREVLDATATIELAPQLGSLGPGERDCMTKLLAVGAIMQGLYERERHHQADDVREALASAQDGPRVDGLRDLYRLFQGPIATTLDNRREPFVAVDHEAPGKAVYPYNITKEEIEAFLSGAPDRRARLLDLRTVVRRATKAAIAADLEALDDHPMLDALHPGLRQRLERLQQEPTGLYAVPYSVAHAKDMVRAFELLNEAATAVEPEDAELAAYLQSRARDLVSDDYESGDASWVTGRFGHLNAQIGSYEVYPDGLYGIKAFHSLSLLVRDDKATVELRKAITDLQQFEDSLPYSAHKSVRSDIPVGVYSVVADFGQARGRNTASILPNEAEHARKYGRTILLRANIMRHPKVFAEVANTWKAAVHDDLDDDLTADGTFYRTLWHEIGHYLGVDRTKDGRDLDSALEEHSSAFEEMKADLVSLFVVPALKKSGYHDAARARSIYASGIRRTLQTVQPRAGQPYQTMELMQMNYFLEHKLLSFDAKTGLLKVHYDRYHAVVKSLLQEVLAIQRAGDKARADAFIKRYTTWKEDLHGVIAKNMSAQQSYRYAQMRYAAIDG